MPKYFTGTYNRAGAVCSVYPNPNPNVTGGVYIVDAKLYVGNNLVKHVAGDLETGPLTQTIGAVFDSTHFPHGTNLEVRCQFMDNFFRIFSASKFCPVKNRALLYEHPHANGHPSGVAALGNILAGKNYALVGRTGASWSESTVYNDMADMSLAYFNTHGTPTNVTAGNGTLMSSGEIETTRIAVNGNGYPPFNPTGNPTTQLVALDACNVGDTSGFLTWFWPHLNSYSEWEPNQALWTWSGYCYFNDSADIVNELWPNLVSGYTIGYSRVEFVQKCILRSGETPPYIRYSPDNVVVRSTLYLSDVPLYGDVHMRIKSVYTGTSTAPVGWYR